MPLLLQLLLALSLMSLSKGTARWDPNGYSIYRRAQPIMQYRSHRPVQHLVYPARYIHRYPHSVADFRSPAEQVTNTEAVHLRTAPVESTNVSAKSAVTLPTLEVAAAWNGPDVRTAHLQNIVAPGMSSEELLAVAAARMEVAITSALRPILALLQNRSSAPENLYSDSPTEMPSPTPVAADAQQSARLLHKGHPYKLFHPRASPILEHLPQASWTEPMRLASSSPTLTEATVASTAL